MQALTSAVRRFDAQTEVVAEPWSDGARRDAYSRLALLQDLLVERINGPLRVIGLRLVPPHAGMRVLDIGCGTGGQLEHYQHAGCLISGIDQSAAMLARARDRLSGDADLRLGSAESLPYPDGRFDLVVASLVLHELTPDTQEAVLAEIRRVLAADGRILVTDFHPGRRAFPKGWLYRAVTVVAESIARHRDRSNAFLSAGGIPAIAAARGLTVECTKVVSGGNIALYVLKERPAR